MRIGIDARFYGVHAGIGRYVRNLISNLEQIDKENEYFIFLLSKGFNLTSFNKNFHKVEANFPWYGISEQTKFPSLLKKYKLDLVHFPHFNAPIFYNGEFIVTVHDLIHQKFTMKRVTTHNPLVYKIKHLGYMATFKKAIKKSDKVITVSEFVKNELIDYWRVSSNKIIVTPEAVEQKFLDNSKKIDRNFVQKTLDKFNIKAPFIYYIGNAHPHKNVEGLIKAFLTLRKKYQYLSLVLAGYDNYFLLK